MFAMKTSYMLALEFNELHVVELLEIGGKHTMHIEQGFEKEWRGGGLIKLDYFIGRFSKVVSRDQEPKFGSLEEIFYFPQIFFFNFQQFLPALDGF